MKKDLTVSVLIARKHELELALLTALRYHTNLFVAETGVYVDTITFDMSDVLVSGSTRSRRAVTNVCVKLDLNE
jgi:hypothetical protein